MIRIASIVTLLTISLAQPAAGQARLGEIDYVAGYTAFARPGLINVVVEIPAGTNEKWMVDKSSGLLIWEKKDGKPRVVQYLAYPANYGMIPRTKLPRELGGDDDPLDILVLGPQLKRGAVVQARPIGVLQLLDGGERDDKILAVQTSGPLSDVVDLDSLEHRYPGILPIVENWFVNYKGAGTTTSGGFRDVEDAINII